MHLAYIIGTYPQASETFIAREVAGMRARGHVVDLYSLYAPKEREVGVTYGWSSSTARVVRKLGGTAADRTLARRWRRRVAESGVEVVVAHFGSQPSTIAQEVAGALPLLVSLHARDLYVEAERLAEKCARAAAVVTCTAANAAYLRHLFPECASRIHLLYHGLPSAWLEAPLPARIRPDKASLRLLAMGRFVEKKGYSVLLEACAILRQRGQPFELRLVGAGPLQKALTAQSQRLGIAEGVQWPGWLPPADVREAYAWADLFCCPSLLAADGDRDGLPNVLTEAMSTGLPAIGSRFSALPEAIIQDGTGILVPPGDAPAFAEALIRLTDPARRASLGLAAASHIRTHFAARPGLDLLEMLLRQAICSQ